MDALQMLREDHRKVKELFRQFEEAENKATRQAIADTVLVELNIHAMIEEEIFYPAVRRQGNGSGEVVQRAEQEHHTAEQLMDEIMKMDAGAAEFEAKFHVLIENVKSHIDEEEAEMLPQAAEAGLSRMEQLGERMAERRAQLMSEGRSRPTSGTRPKSTSATPSRSSSGTRTKASSGTRSRSTAGSRSGSSSGTRSRTTSSTRPRTVAQAGPRKRTTQTRGKKSGRRSGGQSGR